MNVIAGSCESRSAQAVGTVNQPYTLVSANAERAVFGLDVGSRDSSNGIPGRRTTYRLYGRLGMMVTTRICDFEGAIAI